MEHSEQKWPLYSTSSSSELSDTSFFAIIELESRDEVNPVAKEEGRGDEEVFEVFKTIRAESHSAEGAAAGCAPERSSLTGGVPSVSNAGVVGGSNKSEHKR